MTSKNNLSTTHVASQTPAVEHVLNIFKAVLSTAPFTGGLASLLTDYIPTAKQRRLEEFATQVAEDLQELQAKVREDVLQTDDFAFMFEKCLRGVAENYQPAKLEAFRGILVNAATGFYASEAEKEYFITLVGTLSGLHLRILTFMSSPVRYLQDMQIPHGRVRGGFSNFLPVVIPGVDVQVLRSAFGDLYQYGFLNTDKSIFETMTSAQGLQLVSDGGRVTPLGMKFISFCSVTM